MKEKTKWLIVFIALNLMMIYGISRFHLLFKIYKKPVMNLPYAKMIIIAIAIYIFLVYKFMKKLYESIPISMGVFSTYTFLGLVNLFLSNDIALSLVLALCGILGIFYVYNNYPSE